jgi:hypothetical protein
MIHVSGQLLTGIEGLGIGVLIHLGALLNGSCDDVTCLSGLTARSDPVVQDAVI